MNFLLLTAVLIVPHETVCVSQPLHGWERVTTKSRPAVIGMVRRNEAIMKEMTTLECTSYKSVREGKPLEKFYLREWWWKAIKHRHSA